MPTPPKSALTQTIKRETKRFIVALNKLVVLKRPSRRRKAA